MAPKKKETCVRISTTKKQAAAASASASESGAAAASASAIQPAIQSTPTGFPASSLKSKGKSAAGTSSEETSCISGLLSQEQNQAQLPLAPDSASNSIRMDGAGAVPSVGRRSPSGQAHSYSRRERELFAAIRRTIQNTFVAERFIRETGQRPREAWADDVVVAAEGFNIQLDMQVFPAIVSSLSRIWQQAQENTDMGTVEATRDAANEMDNTFASYGAAREILRVRNANWQQSGGTNATDSSRTSNGDDGNGPDGSGSGDRTVD